MPYPVMNTLLDGGYPAGRAQLLALELHRRAHRTGSSTRWSSASHCPVADDGDPLRALPRRGHARRRRPTPPCRTAQPGWNLLIPSVWTDPADTDANVALDARDVRRARGRTWPSGRWLNYLGDDQGDDAIRAAYGPNYDRLRRGQAPLRPRQRLPSQPQRPALGRSCRRSGGVPPSGGRRRSRPAGVPGELAVGHGVALERRSVDGLSRRPELSTGLDLPSRELDVPGPSRRVDHEVTALNAALLGDEARRQPARASACEPRGVAALGVVLPARARAQPVAERRTSDDRTNATRRPSDIG